MGDNHQWKTTSYREISRFRYAIYSCCDHVYCISGIAWTRARGGCAAVPGAGLAGYRAHHHLCGAGGEGVQDCGAADAGAWGGGAGLSLNLSQDSALQLAQDSWGGGEVCGRIRVRSAYRGYLGHQQLSEDKQVTSNCYNLHYDTDEVVFDTKFSPLVTSKSVQLKAQFILI